MNLLPFAVEFARACVTDLEVKHNINIYIICLFKLQCPVGVLVRILIQHLTVTSCNDKNHLHPGMHRDILMMASANPYSLFSVKMTCHLIMILFLLRRRCSLLFIVAAITS